jgi:hypothetical protein
VATIEVLIGASRSALARGACLFFSLEDGLDAAEHLLDVIAVLVDAVLHALRRLFLLGTVTNFY